MNGRLISSSALPLIVAVAGHRDIAPTAESRLRETFGGLLAKLQAQYPWSPLTVLSALAPGASILAAEAALERNIPVIAALPMPRDRYEQAFTGSQRERFDAAVSQCERVDVIGNEFDSTLDNTALHAHLAYYGSFLVAFWDGDRNADTDTAALVELRSTGITKPQARLGAYVPDIGPVYQIVTPRADQPEPENAYDVVEFYPDRFEGDRTCERDFLSAIKHYHAFDRDLSRTPETAEQLSLPKLMERVDGIANRLQKWNLRVIAGLYFLAFLAGSAQLVAGTGGLLWKVGFLALAFACFLVVRRLDLENRYQDYRALAEGLRVQLAWQAAGLTHLRVESKYLRMQQGELSWIRMALRTIYLLYIGESATPAAVDRSAVMSWIDSQRDYYKRATARESGRARMYDRLASVATGIAVLIVIPLIVALIFKQHIAWASHANVPIAVAALAALLLRFYIQQRGFKENGRRYHHMFSVFDFARRRVDALGDNPPPKDYETTVSELGQEALAEHASWLLLHRERPLRVVST